MSITAASLAVMCLVMQRPDPECELPDPPCPTGHGDDAYVFPALVNPAPASVDDDHRPVVRIAAWNGNWTNDTYGRADWYKNETPMEVADPADPMETICIPTGIYNLLERMKVCYARGFRRMIVMLPAGTINGQADMASSQWGPMPGSYRAAYMSYIKPWLDAKDSALDPVSFGVYAGFPLDNVEGSCSLVINSGNRHAPNLKNSADAIQFKENVQPWIDVGVDEYWLDASSGSVGFFDYLAADNDYNGIKFGGEAIPGSAGEYDCDLVPNQTALNRVAWTCTMPFAETRFDQLSPSLDIWTSASPATTEAGVWMDTVPEMCDIEAEIPLTLDRAKLYYDLGWVLWGTESATINAEYLKYTGMELMQRIYDFGPITAAADYDCSGFHRHRRLLRGLQRRLRIHGQRRAYVPRWRLRQERRCRQR